MLKGAKGRKKAKANQSQCRQSQLPLTMVAVELACVGTAHRVCERVDGWGPSPELRIQLGPAWDRESELVTTSQGRLMLLTYFHPFAQKSPDWFNDCPQIFLQPLGPCSVPALLHSIRGRKGREGQGRAGRHTHVLKRDSGFRDSH